MSRGGSFRSVALGVAWRSLHSALTNPALLVPSLIFPLFFLAAFAGGLSSIANVPNFDYPAGYTAFQFVFVLLQSAAFGGVFIGFGMAADFESGFTRRLLLAAPRRSAIVAGYALAGLGRFVVTAVLVTGVSLLAGMDVLGGAVDLVGLYGLAALTNLAAVLWGLGVAMRIRSIQGGPLMQTPVFLILFLAPVYVPAALLDGWIAFVASINPATALLDAGRGLLAGAPEGVALAFGVGLALVALFVLWAATGLRRAEAAG